MLKGFGFKGQFLIMQSNGGSMSPATAQRVPVATMESGPVGGIIAAAEAARDLGIADVIAFDMGGTTAKASLIENGAVSRGREYEVGGSLSAGSRLMRGAGELLRIPTIDIAEVGAGGGSVAWLDPAGGLQVGPRSAGAAPGPACYDRGGEEPTVTDANVFLGYIPEGPLADSIRRKLVETLDSPYNQARRCLLRRSSCVSRRSRWVLQSALELTDLWDIGTSPVTS